MGLQTENFRAQECVSIRGDARKQRIPHPICLAIPLCQNFHLLTFHITDLDHFLGHFTSKNGRFFLPPTPHTVMTAKAVQFGRENIPLYSISPRVRPIFGTFYLKNRGPKNGVCSPLRHHLRRYSSDSAATRAPRSANIGENSDKLLQFKLI